MKFNVTTTIPDKVKEALDIGGKEALEKGKGMVEFSYTDNGGGNFVVVFDYPLSNYVTDRGLKRHFINTILKIDPNIKVEEIKKGWFGKNVKSN